MCIISWISYLRKGSKEIESLEARIRELESQLEKARDENLALARKMESLEGRITALS
jgi:peptidoglycan hydrolase CwlO-like protein